VASSKKYAIEVNIRDGHDGLVIDGGTTGTLAQGLVCTGGSGNGVTISDVSGTTIKGSVRSFHGNGVDIAGAADNTTITAVITGNGGDGILVNVNPGTTNVLLLKNGVNGNGLDGINTSGPVTIIQNIVNGNGGHGIEAGVGAIAGGHNFAKANKTPPQCVGVVCQ
jgi:hypothetical protein